MAEYRRKKREQAQLPAQQQQLQHSTQQQEVDVQLQSQEARERSPGQPVPCIIEVPEPERHGQTKCIGLTYPFASSEPQRVPIVRSQILLDALTIDDKDCKSITEVTLDISELCSELEWQPGDTIGIIPSNSKNDVADLLHLLGLAEKAEIKCRVEASAVTSKKTAKVPAHIPSPSTPRELLQDCLNIRSVCKKQFLSSLSGYCSDPDEKNFLRCLSSKEAAMFYNDLIMVRGFTLNDILKLCPTCRPPLNLIIEHFGRLLPRPYSIANSPLGNSKELSIIYSTLNCKSGVTTSMLTKKGKEKGASLLIYKRQPNLFRFTEEDLGNNQILIAIGTGLAPFLGFLQHKQHLVAQGLNDLPGQTWMFVGATKPEAVLYKDQIIKWQSNNVLNKFNEAFSRTVPPSTNQYVQESLEKCSHEFADFLMQPKTILYLCADAGQISKCIEKSIAKIMEKELDLSETETLQMVKEFKSTGKFREDLWI